MKALSMIAQWDTFEAAFEGPSAGNPYLDVTLHAIFTFSNRAIKVPGFYDGDGVYRVRFMPDTPGEWTYRTVSNVAELDGTSGIFSCAAPRPGMHGPVTVRNKFHFAHADGTPYFPFGTTCYAWTHQPLEMQAQALTTLSGTRFSKLRMSAFPKDYIYNEDEPLYRPFELNERCESEIRKSHSLGKASRFRAFSTYPSPHRVTAFGRRTPSTRIRPDRRKRCESNRAQLDPGEIVIAPDLSALEGDLQPIESLVVAVRQTKGRTRRRW
jgi:hypothetical protein